MNQENIEAYAPKFRQAVIDINNLNKPVYVREEDLQLHRTADVEEWAPSDEIIELVENAATIPISLINKETNFTRLLNVLLNQESIGLVLMGDQYGARKRPAIIVLTTATCYYVIDPNHSEGIDFLKRCLSPSEHPTLTFWTTHGLKDACCLREQYNISLQDSNARDCLGMHLHLMKILALAPKNHDHDEGSFLGYPHRAIMHAHKCQKRLERFEKLVHLWLDIDDRNIDCDSGQFRHLSTRPLNLTAENLVRKRCTLVLCLAEELMRYSRLELSIMSRNVVNALTRAGPSISIQKEIRQAFKEYEKAKRPSPLYFAHLD